MEGKILVTGSEGLVGSRFVEISAHKTELHTPKLIEFDITSKSEVKAVISSFAFTHIINFAAYTDVNGAETERENKSGACWQINVEGVRNIAEAVSENSRKIHFIHISTDMVFPGDKKDKGPYAEDHPAGTDLGRLTWYGYSKAQGEKAAKEILGDNSTIVRIIYPVRAKFEAKPDYLRKALNMFDQGKLYPMFKDQQVSIAYIDEVCMALDEIIKRNISGIFHVSSRDTATPFELVNYLLEKTRGVQNAVKPSKLDDFIKSTASPLYRYPKYGGLKTEKTEKLLGLSFSTWREIIDKLVSQGLGKQ